MGTAQKRYGTGYLQKTTTMRKIGSYLKAHPIYMKTAVENSVQGFIDFAAKPPM